MDKQTKITALEALMQDSQFLQAYSLTPSKQALFALPGAKGKALACRLSYHLGAWRLSQAWTFFAQRHYAKDLDLGVTWAGWLEDRQGPLAALRYLRKREEQADNPSPESRADAASRKAFCCAALHDDVAALGYCQKAQTLDPKDPWHWVSKAQVLVRLDHYDQALWACGRALALQATYRPAVQMNAHLLVLQGQQDLALLALQAANDRGQSFSVAYTLAGLALQEGALELATEAIDCARRYAPLAEKGCDRTILVHEIELACLSRCWAKAASKARQLSDGYHQTLAKKLAATPAEAAEDRHVLAVEFIRQHHNTCGPATLSSLCAWWERAIPMAHIVAEIWYGGTFDFAERQWAASHGWWVKEFSLDWPTACALIERGMPFALRTQDAGSGHMQAVIGVDRIRETLVVRDPYNPEQVEILQAQFLAGQAAFGPSALLLLPAGKEAQLAGLALPEMAQYDLYYEMQLQLEKHDRNAALANLATLRTQYGQSRMVLMAQFSLASYDNNNHAILAAVEALLARYPNDSNLQLKKVAVLRALGRTASLLEWLEKHLKKEGHPRMLMAMAALLVEDHRYHERVRTLLRQTSKALSTDAEWHAIHADLAWRHRQYGRALLYYRYASCLENTNEQYVRKFVAAASTRNCLDQALHFLQKRFLQLGEHGAAPGMAFVRALDEANQVKRAIKTLWQALGQRPEDAELLLFGASYLQGLTHLEDADTLLSRAKPLARPTDWLRIKARQAELQGDERQALLYWRKLLEQDPLREDALHAMADDIASTEGAAAVVTELQQRLQQYPAHPVIVDILLQWLESLGEFQQALTLLEKRLEDDPQNINAWREKARLSAMSGDNQGAWTHALALLEIDPLESVSHELQGWLARRIGNTNDAKKAFDRAITLNPDSEFSIVQRLRLAAGTQERQRIVQQVIQELRQQVIQGNGLLSLQAEACKTLAGQELLAMLKEALGERADLWQAHTAVIYQQLHLDQLSDALASAQTMVKSFPYLPRSYMELAKVYETMDEATKESSALEKAQKLSPLWLDPVRRLADLAENRKDWVEYRKLIETALKAAPRDASMWGYLATAQEQDNDQPAAIQSLQQAVELQRDYDWAWDRLVELLRANQREAEIHALLARHCTQYPGEIGVYQRAARFSQDQEEALGLLEKARALDHANPDCHCAVIEQLATLGRYEEAQKEIDHPVWKGAVPPIVALQRSTLLRDSGHPIQARRALLPLLKENPDLLQGWQMLLQWAEQDRDTDIYRQSLFELHRLLPHHVQYASQLAELEQHNGRTAEARVILQRMYRLHPSNEYASFGYLDFLLEQQDWQQAKEVFLDGLPRFPWSVTYARGIVLAAQEKDTTQAQHYFDELLKNPDPGEWALETAKTALNQIIPAERILHRLQHAVEKTQKDTIGDSLVCAWASLILAAHGNSKIMHHFKHVLAAHTAKTPILEGLLDAILQSDARKDSVLRWLINQYGELMKKQEVLWGTAINALNRQFQEPMAIAFGADWREHPQAPSYALYHLASANAALFRWQETIAIAKTGLQRPADEFTPWLQLQWIAYGFALGQEELIDQQFHKLAPETLEDEAQYTICHISAQWRKDTTPGQTLDSKRFRQIIASYKDVSAEDDAEAKALAEAHLLKICEKHNSQGLIRWFLRFKENRQRQKLQRAARRWGAL